VWAITILTTGFALLATVGLLWPGIGTDAPDGALPEGFGRWDYEATQILPLVVLFLIGVGFYVAGRGVREKPVQVSLEDDQPLTAGTST